MNPEHASGEILGRMKQESPVGKKKIQRWETITLP